MDMTDKELQKLTREDLLRLLLSQEQDLEKAKKLLLEVRDERHQYAEEKKRFEEKLGDRDELIAQLKQRVAEKDEQRSTLARQLEEREARIRELNDKVELQSGEIHELWDRIWSILVRNGK